MVEQSNGHHGNGAEKSAAPDFHQLAGLVREVKAVLDPELGHDDNVDLSEETVLSELKSINE